LTQHFVALKAHARDCHASKILAVFGYGNFFFEVGIVDIERELGVVFITPDLGARACGFTGT
jgi:hypothetical protein